MHRWLSPALLAFLSTHAVVHAAPAVADTVLITDGHLMTFDAELGDIEGGDILIRDGRIVAIGKDIQADDARRIDANGAFVLPGFVDVHSHLWITTMRGQFRNADGEFFDVSSQLAPSMTPEDIHTAMFAGVMEQLDGGITTTADFFDNVLTPAHGDAALRALTEAGGRAVLHYGGADKTTATSIDLEHLRTLAAAQPEDARVQLGLAWRLPRDRDDDRNWAMRQAEYDMARELELPIQVHVSGEPAPMFDALIEGKYLRPGVTVVHATDASDEHLQALESAGTSLALTPLSEQRVGYGLTRLDHFRAVTRQGLGIDGNTLAGSADMFATMRLGALTWSGGARDESAPSPRDILALATLRGAQALGLDAQIGSLTVGKHADIQIIDTGTLNMSGFGGGDPAALIVYSAQPVNVRTVLVGGKAVKEDGQLVGVDVPALLARTQASAAALLEKADAR